MKLRIKGDSLRLRVGPSEVERLMRCGRIEESIHFAPSVQLIYALERSECVASVSVRYAGGEIVVTVPARIADAWASGTDIGIKDAVGYGLGTLAIIVEKDFACLDPSHSENQDTYPNPKGAC